MKTLAALLSLFTGASCAPTLRLVTKSEPPLRYALGAPEPRALHRVLGVELSVHDSAPDSAKPTLLCLHAIGHGGGDFARLENVVGASWRVVMVDWPSQGRSGDDPQPASARRYADLLGALIDELKLTNVVILGNSIGGAAAIRYAASNPTNVRALILANPGGLDPGGFLARLFIGNLVDHFEWGARNEERFAAWFRDYYADILITDAARVQREHITAAGYETAPMLSQAWRSFAEPDANLSPLLSRVTMPVLFTWASKDKLVSWDRNRAAVERFPNAKVEFFEAGHAPFLETPAPFDAALLRFLATVP